MDQPERRLALIELLERDGRVRRTIEVHRWPVTLGRALDNDIVLEDPHVAAHHVRLQPDESGTLQMQVGTTRNGVQVGPRTAVEGETCAVPLHGEVWQLGATRVRVRLPGEELEPERPLGLAATGARPWTTALSAGGVWALLLADHAVHLDPGSSLSDWLLPLLAVPAAAVGWCLLWAVGSKLFQHRFDFWAHFAVLVKGGLAIVLVDLLLPLVAFALSWEWLSRITPVVGALVVAAMLYRHATLVAPVNHRWVAAGLGACLLLGGLVLGTLNWQRSDRLFDELYVSTLPPPALRLAPGVSARELVGELRDLRPRLDRQVDGTAAETGDETEP